MRRRLRGRRWQGGGRRGWEVEVEEGAGRRKKKRRGGEDGRDTFFEVD